MKTQEEVVQDVAEALHAHIVGGCGCRLVEPCEDCTGPCLVCGRTE